MLKGGGGAILGFVIFSALLALVQLEVFPCLRYLHLFDAISKGGKKEEKKRMYLWWILFL